MIRIDNNYLKILLEFILLWHKNFVRNEPSFSMLVCGKNETHCIQYFANLLYKRNVLKTPQWILVNEHGVYMHEFTRVNERSVYMGQFTTSTSVASIKPFNDTVTTCKTLGKLTKTENFSSFDLVCVLGPNSENEWNVIKVIRHDEIEYYPNFKVLATIKMRKPLLPIIIPDLSPLEEDALRALIIQQRKSSPIPMRRPMMFKQSNGISTKQTPLLSKKDSDRNTK